MSAIFACPRNRDHFLIWRQGGVHWCAECVRSFTPEELERR